MPLSWIIGPMVGSALFSNLVGATSSSIHARQSGQMIIGASTGALVTPQGLRELGHLVPAMVAAAVAANCASLALAFVFARIARTDRTTALLSTLPAGISAMAPLALEVNAHSQTVAVAHTIRVVMVVLCIPLYFGFLGQADAASEAISGATYGPLVICIALSAVAAAAASRVGLLNAWVIVPMAISMLATLAGWQLHVLPEFVLVIAQLLIGFSLGARFDASDFLLLPRAAVASLVCGGILIAFTLFVVVPMLDLLTALDSSTLGMSVAPGGIGEMIAAAKAMGMGSATVAGFQFTRSFLTNVLTPVFIARLAPHGRSRRGVSEE
jgi:membrane AbrB-like protein